MCQLVGVGSDKEALPCPAAGVVKCRRLGLPTLFLLLQGEPVLSQLLRKCFFRNKVTIASQASISYSKDY